MGLGNLVFLKLRLLIVVFSVVFFIEMLMMRLRVKMLFIRIWLEFCFLVNLVLMCNGCRLSVSVENRRLLVLVIVWVGWCLKVMLILSLLKYFLDIVFFGELFWFWLFEWFWWYYMICVFSCFMICCWMVGLCLGFVDCVYVYLFLVIYCLECGWFGFVFVCEFGVCLVVCFVWGVWDFVWGCVFVWCWWLWCSDCLLLRCVGDWFC